MNKPRVLFVLKLREQPYDDYGSANGDHFSSVGKVLHSGLYNSATMVCDMLDANGVDSKLVHVVDNNSIHREIVAFDATHVIIEAFWVVPPKFEELHKACPNVQFIVRNHSETPFLANEGIAFDWSLEYAKLPNVAISCNAPRMLEETRFLVKTLRPELSDPQVNEKVPYLPNFYPTPDGPTHRPHRDRPHLDIGCFGAVRPLKNHMIQAIAALKFAEHQGKRLRFHINSSRIEGNGSPILHNLQKLFRQFGRRHELVEQPWLPHADFRRLVGTMDMVLQVSLSETFNIVAADAVTQGIPTIVSKEVPWGLDPFRADPNSSENIAHVMAEAAALKRVAPRFNPSLGGLRDYNRDSEREWLSYFGAI